MNSNNLCHSLESLYSAAEEGTLMHLRTNLSKGDRCDMFCQAVMDRQMEVSRILLTNGLAQNIESTPEDTAAAATRAKSEIIEMLVERFSQKNDLPASLFMDLAINEGNSQLVSIILSKGVDAHAKVSGPFTAIQLAVMQGHPTIVEILLAANANVNSKHKGSTLLHAAVLRDDVKITSLLLQYGAIVDTKRRDGTTALYTAVDNGFSEIATKLIDAGADLEVKFISYNLDPLKEKIMSQRDVILTSRGLSPRHITAEYLSRCVRNRTLLHIAAEKGFSKIVELLLSRGADLNSCDNFGRTALYLATFNCHAEVIKLLCEHGADINAKFSDGQTLLHYFAVGGCLESAKILLEFGANMNVENSRGLTPFFSAVESNQLTIVKLLMENGAKTRHSRDGSTPLHAAADFGSTDVVRFLLSSGMDPNSLNSSGETALHLAVWKGRKAIARLLLKKGADVNATTSQRDNGRTALLIATNEGDLKSVETLLKFGANVDFKDSGFHESSALRIATEKGFYQLVELLLNFGANIELRDRNGTTALLLAVDTIGFIPEVPTIRTYHGILRDHLEVIKTLLRFSADVHAKDKKGRTPLTLALRQNKLLVLNVFLEYGNADIRTLPESSANWLSDEVRVGSTLFHRTIVNHIIKMKAANLYVGSRTLITKNFGDLSEIEVFQRECEVEVAKMKIEKIEDSTLSFYDLLTAEIFEVAVILNDPGESETLIRKFRACDLVEIFPIYGNILHNQFEKGMIRKELLDKGIQICNALFNRIYALPNDITWRITVMYLDSKDLRTVIAAVRGSSVLVVANSLTNE